MPRLQTQKRVLLASVTRGKNPPKWGLGSQTLQEERRLRKLGEYWGQKAGEDTACSPVCLPIFDRPSFRKYEERCFGLFLL